MIDLVLMELDELDLVVLRADNDGLFLESAADGDGSVVRWLRVPTDRLEIRALIRGAVSIYDALRKDRVWLVDRRPDRSVVRAWALSGDELTEDALPEIGALLPDLIRAELVALPEYAAVSAARLAIVGDPVQGHEIPFADLSAFTGATQRLWTALALSKAPKPGRWGRDADVSRRSMLYAAATGPGSFVIEVRPADPAMFELSADAYARLTAAGTDVDRLRAELRPLGARVASAFSSYLRTLRVHRLSVLAEWGARAAFVSPNIAERTSVHVKAAKATEGESFAIQGWFVSLDVASQRPNFKLHDLVEHETLEGSIAPALIDKMARADVSIQVGWGVAYEAVLSVTVREGIVAELGTEAFELVDYREMGPMPHSRP